MPGNLNYEKLNRGCSGLFVLQATHCLSIYQRYTFLGKTIIAVQGFAISLIDIFITGVGGQVISGILDLILVLVWLYGIYTGYRASRGMNANIPYLSDYASKL